MNKKAIFLSHLILIGHLDFWKILPVQWMFLYAITNGSKRRSLSNTSEIFVFLHPIEKTTNHLCQNTKTMLL